MNWRRSASALYPPLLSAAVMAAIGALGIWAGEAWLFPSLGPTIFLQAVTPNSRAARLWNTLVGHALGVGAAFAAVAAFGAQHAPSTLVADMLAPSRVAATALAVGATVAGQLLLRAQHPPAAATTMLITLGAMKADLRTVVLIAAGVALVAAMGECGRIVHPARERSAGASDRSGAEGEG